MIWDEIPTNKICGRCNIRKATQIIAMGGIHGGPYEYWCEYDLYKDKLIYAQKEANKIPDLEAKLKTLEETT